MFSRYFISNEDIKKYIFYPVFTFLILSGCSKSDDSSGPNKNPENTVQKNSVEESISAYKIENYFWSYVKKVKRSNNATIALQYYRTSSKSKIQTKLIKVYDNGRFQELVLSDDETWLDFDIKPNGEDIVGLISKEETVLDPDFGLSLKKLVIQIYSGDKVDKQFQFSDSLRLTAVKYDKSGNARLSKHYDNTEDLFLTSSAMVDFARIAAGEDRVYLSVCGTMGFKAFAFDQNGKELWQNDLVPLSDFNTVIVDKEAPYIALVGDMLFSATEITDDEEIIFEKHFGINVVWPSGPKYGVVVQSISTSSRQRSVVLAKGNGNIFLNNIALSKIGDVTLFGLVGTAGGPGARSAIAKMYDQNLKPYFEIDLGIQKETSGLSLNMTKDGFYVGGKYGSSQVSTGSVVEYADAFIVKYSWDGLQIRKKYFGTDRDDSVGTIFLGPSEELYVGGMLDGPITHTADQNPEFGFSKSLFGVLIW